MLIRLSHIFIILVAILFGSCARNDDKIINHAIAVLEERPDSAYLQLKDVEYNMLDDDGSRAAYGLVHARDNMYMGRSLEKKIEAYNIIDLISAKML